MYIYLNMYIRSTYQGGIECWSRKVICASVTPAACDPRIRFPELPLGCPLSDMSLKSDDALWRDWVYS